jgi:hypothetical protein
MGAGAKEEKREGDQKEGTYYTTHMAKFFRLKVNIKGY